MPGPWLTGLASQLVGSRLSLEGGFKGLVNSTRPPVWGIKYVPKDWVLVVIIDLRDLLLTGFETESLSLPPGPL